MKLSNQAIGALMMTLQKCLMEETDIVPLLKDTDWITDGAGDLVVTNPPVVTLQDTNIKNVPDFIDEALEDTDDTAEA